MDKSLKCKEIISRMISLIFDYTGIYANNLTEAIVTLMYVKEQSDKRLKEIFNGTIRRLTANDLTGITAVPRALFQDNQNLEYVELPDTVTVLGDNCFFGCANLNMPSLPEGIERFGSNNFYGCSSLTIEKLPDSLNYIGTNVFTNCASLRISEIPAGVTYLGRGAFLGCTSLETITFKGTPTSVDRSIFSSCTNLREINVPWAEGAISYAPWGATNAVINYNCTE